MPAAKPGGRIRNIDAFLALLEGVKQARDGQWIAKCPGHSDSQPSLSIKEADGKILLKCFAGCELVDILKPLELEPADLFLDAPKVKLQERAIEAIYHYTDATGKPFEVVRTRPKGFYQRRPDGKGGYINNLRGIKPTLYHADQLEQAIATGTAIYIVEGEKDADRLLSLGLVATTSPMGAGKWRESYSKALAGGDIIPIPDNDRPGRDHVTQLCRSCWGKVKRCRVLLLPAEVKDISDWLDQGGNIEQLEKLLANSPDYELPADAALPEVMVTDRQLREITAGTLDALYKANKPAQIFRRSGALTRVNLDEKGRPYTESLGESALRGILTRSCNFVRATAKDDIATAPPLEVVRDILSLSAWDFPALLGITESPVIRPDGTIITEPGYDEATNLYYRPTRDLKVPPIPDQPSADAVKSATKLVLEPLRQFPFDSDASRANAIGTLLLPILRPLIKGSTPLALFDKPSAGTGASLLAKVISLIATGRSAAIMTAPKNDEEWNKSITSLLLKGQTVVVIDNIEFDLQSPSLAAVLTADIYQSRVLGRSESILLPNRSTWIGTGNNIRLRGDLPRRCVWCRMDAKMARPWTRTGTGVFDHPDLEGWVAKTRGDILGAILTIARAWVVAGMPEAPESPSLGGYEGYCEVISGVLAFIGIKGFLGNLTAMYDETDTETPQWEAFLDNLHDAIGNRPVAVAELVGYLVDKPELHDALPDIISDMSVKNYRRRLGNALAKKKGVLFPNGYSIIKTAKGKYGATWQVVTPGDSEKQKNGESHQAKLAMDGDSGDSALNPSRVVDNKINDNILYRTEVAQESPESPQAQKSVTLPPNYPPIYPTHACLKCGSDKWAMSPDGLSYVCSECDSPHPAGCEYCRPEQGALESKEGKV
jgi:hypothetical protein